jgi:hypothetical protein
MVVKTYTDSVAVMVLLQSFLLSYGQKQSRLQRLLGATKCYGATL